MNFCFLTESIRCIFIKMPLTLWIFWLLCSLTASHGLTQFPQNFVVAKRNDANPVTLSCDSRTDGAITWTFHGEVIEDVTLEENVKQEGQNLIMSDVGTPMLGQYSCWRKGELVSSVYLLMEAEEEDELDSPIQCRAKSYDCNFSCMWTHSESTAVRFALGQNCHEGGKSCHWVSGSKQLLDGGFQAKLSHSLSPFSEERTMLHVTAEAIINFSILRRSKKFHLRDIVQPDSPHIVKFQKMEQDLNVTIEPPASWSTPHSFFNLEHEIEYILRDDGQIGRSASTLIPKRISKLRVRCRDSLLLSAWSQWTAWKNVTH